MGSNGSASHKLLMVGEEGTIIRTITCQGLKCPPTASAVHGNESIGWTGISAEKNGFQTQSDKDGKWETKNSTHHERGIR